MITKEQIVEMLRSNDKALARALVVLNRNQTATEQASESTINRNGMGFRPCHARMGTSMANFYSRRGYLSPKQVAYWRKTQRDGKMRIEIYAGQLLEAAKLKAAGATQVAINTPPAKAVVPVKKNPYVGEDIGNLMERHMVLCEELDGYQEGAFGEGPEQTRVMDELTKEIGLIDLAVRAMVAEADMQRMDQQADQDQTRDDELNKFLARCRMERR